MKLTAKTAFRILIVGALVFVLVFALCACADGEDEQKSSDDNAPSFYYAQDEVEGYAKSAANLNRYEGCRDKAEPLFVIPGLKKGRNFILQGVEYCEELNWTFLCGYINPSTDKSNSVIFVLDMNKTKVASNGKVYNGVLIKELFLEKENGEAFKGHAGGIAVTQKNVWIANGSKLHRISLDTVKNATESGNVKIEGSVSVPVLASYCSYSDGILWVGEFEYARDDYNTDAAHHNPQNASLTAWSAGYRIDESGAEGFDETTGFLSANMKNTLVPDFVLWHGEKVQGMAEVGSKLVLSISYGRKNASKLLIYDNFVRGKNARECDITVQISGESVPCYILASPVKSVTAPPMTEDLSTVLKNGEYKIFVATESSAYYYHGYKLLNRSVDPLDTVWSFTVEQ